jgi:hypothetical protein
MGAMKDAILLLRHTWAQFGAVFLLVAGVALFAGIMQALDRFPRGPGEAAVLTAAAVVFGTIGVVMLRKGLRGYRRERRLRQIGTPTEGVVVAIAQGDLVVNDAAQWVIRYTFADHRGRVHEGVSREMAADEAGRWQAGDKGRVLFDRENPSDSVWVATIE